MTTFTGLVQANLAMEKVKEALAIAKEAVTAMPKCSQAFLTYGTVLVQSSPTSTEVQFTTP